LEKIMKRLALLALGSLILAGCSQDAPPSAPPESSKPAVATEAVEKKAPTSVEPQASTVFNDDPSCIRAGYGAAQCARARSTADAMSRVDRPVYNSFAECKKLFKNCSEEGAKPSYPQMVAYSIGNEEKNQGAPVAVSPSAPLWHEPVYETAQGELVFIKRAASGEISAFPVIPKKKA
jgi:uncharacterized protein YgiB involved in biofilm formation